MNLSEELATRRALAAVPASSHADLIVAVLDRIGGHRVLLHVVAEAQNARADRLARRRHSASLRHEVRA